MYGMLLGTHVGAASFMVAGTVLTLAFAWLKRGRLQASKWGLLLSGGVTLLSGSALVMLTGQGMGRICILGTALVAAAWGAYVLLRSRVGAPAHA